MKIKSKFLVLIFTGAVMAFITAWIAPAVFNRKGLASIISAPFSGSYLYVCVPGVRNYLGYGGHGILVFDMNNNHKFVKRIPFQGFRANGTPSNVKGVCVSIPLNSIFVSTLEGMQRIDITTEKVLWEKAYEGGCDRMAISQDGKTMYLPSLEKTFYNVVDCATGDIIKRIDGFKRTHNTIWGLSGNHVYLEGIGDNYLYIADPKTHTVSGKVGPFKGFIRPFTINGKETRVFTSTDSILGFEVGDLSTGKKIASVNVQGWLQGPIKRHYAPSHGVALTPDEKELWICDCTNYNLHVFSTVPPYQQLTTIRCQDMTGWITFSLNGKYAYPSSGEVIDVKTRKILTHLEDEHHNWVQSEKMVQIIFANGKAVKANDQFGVGRVTE